tara:strand:+ start:99 stop:242 length:144 start_codon:yes stop_codon:yes gene_type:complete
MYFKKASSEKLNVFLYGSTEDTLNKLNSFILKEFSRVNICDIHILHY